MEAFSMSVRRRIVKLYQSGLDTNDIAEIFAASPAGVRRVWQRYREEGRIEPRPHGGGQPPRLNEQHKKQVLLELIGQRPDAFIDELREDLSQRTGVSVCRQTLGRWLRQLGVTRKKSRFMPPSRTAPT
jgi:transposase